MNRKPFNRIFARALWVFILCALAAGQPLSGTVVSPAYAQDDSRVVTLTIWRVVESENLDAGEVRQGESGRGDYCADVGFSSIPYPDYVWTFPCESRSLTNTPVVEGEKPWGLFIEEGWTIGPEGAWVIEPFWVVTLDIPRHWGSKVAIEILLKDIDARREALNDPLHRSRMILDLDTKIWTGDGIFVTPACSKSQGIRGAIFFDVKVGSRTGDADGDGLLDNWELNGFDDDCNGSKDVDLPVFGAKFNHKDLFVELDWMAGMRPASAEIQKVKNAFAIAPKDAGTKASDPEYPSLMGGVNAKSNPDLRDGINLWVSPIDNIPGGNEIGVTTNVSGLNEAFYAIRARNFNPNHRLIFRYALSSVNPNTGSGMSTGNNHPLALSDTNQSWFIGEWVGRKVTITGGTGAGQAREIVNNSASVLAIKYDTPWNVIPDNTSTYEISLLGGEGELGGNDFVIFSRAGSFPPDGLVFMHELGHDLNLHHGGFESHNCKPNYVSIMNYDYPFGISRSIGDESMILDFSPPRFFLIGRGVAPLPPLNERGGLNETMPLDSTDGSNRFIFSQYQKIGTEGGRFGLGCSDGMDNNGNGLKDREDPACYMKVPWRLNKPVDWDGDPDTNNAGVVADIDISGNTNAWIPTLPAKFIPSGCDAFGVLNELKGFNDWLHISLPFRQFGDRSASAVNPVIGPEPTYEERLEYQQALDEASNTTDIGITKSASPNPAVAGEQLVYSLSVVNNGRNPSSQGQVVDTLPAGVSYQSNSEGCMHQAGTVTCDLGGLQAGETRGISIVVLVDADLVHNAGGPAMIINTATVANLAGADLDPSNNSVSEEIRVIAQSDLGIVSFEVVDPPAAVLIGEEVDITLRKVVTNNGPSAPMDTTITALAMPPADATIDPLISSFNELALGLAEQREIFETFRIACNQAGQHTFTFTNEIQPLNPEDTDPEQSNNITSMDLDVECIVPVTINIKPGSNPNSINPRNRGVIAVAILSTSVDEYGNPLAFDATTIDPLSVYFGTRDDVWSETGGAAEIHATGHIEDSLELDESTTDGDLDMVFHFAVQHTGIAAGDVEACVKGEWTDASGNVHTFFGCETIRTVGNR